MKRSVFIQLITVFVIKRFHFGHKLDELRDLSQIVQIAVICEKRVTR